MGSGNLLDDKVSGSGEPLGSGGSGASGDISGSVDSEDLGSGVSGLFGSGIILISGGGQYSGLCFALYIYTVRKKNALKLYL